MRRRLAVVLLFGIVLTLIAGVALDWWSGRRVDDEVARLERRYGSLDGRSLVAPPVAAEYNSARFVRAAAALVVGGPNVKSGYPSLMASATRFEKVKEPSSVPRDVQAFIDANREAIRIAEEGSSRHQSSWNADYAGGAWVPHWLDVRTLSDVIALDALVDRKAGRTEDASRKTTAGLALAASLRHEPSLIAQLLRIAIATRHCEGIRSLIADSEPSTADLENLARALADNRETDPMRVGLLAEMRLANAALLNVERGQATDFFDSRESPFWFRRVGRPFVRLARLYYLQEMDRLIELQRGPRPHPPFPNHPRSSRWARWDWWRWVGSNVLPGLERAIENGDRHNSVVGTTEIGVALRRYRLARGGYPDDLTALVPAYLSRLPIDPVTGRPPVYARNGAGFTLRAEPVSRDTPPSAPLEWLVGK